MNRSRAATGALIAGVSIVLLAGCAAAPTPPHEWSDRMSALLADPNGQGGGGGGIAVASGAKNAHGSVELAAVPQGEYDVLAVCNGSGTVGIVVKAAGSPGAVLASSDIACGATLRLPVTVTATGLVLEATNTGDATQWHASVVTPGWQPTPTTSSH